MPISNAIEINFAYECNPWKISLSSNHYDDAIVTSEDSIKLYTNTVIERAKSITGDFGFNFKILGGNGNISFMIGFKSYMNTVNNFSYGEFNGKYKIPTITLLDKVDDVYTLCLGYRRSVSDKNNFDKFGKFDWNVNNPLDVFVNVVDEINLYDSYIVYEWIKGTPVQYSESPVSSDNVYVNGVKGIELSPLIMSNPIISGIPQNGKYVVKIPAASSYADNAKIYITKKGNLPNSELIIASVSSIIESDLDSYHIKKVYTESTIILHNISGQWHLSQVDNFKVFNSTKKIKMKINSLETEFLECSSNEIDYLMFHVAEVNSEFDSNIEIGNINWIR